MPEQTPRVRSIDRRTFIVGGASVVAAGVLAPLAVAEDGEEPESLLVAASVVDHPSSEALDVLPIATGNGVLTNRRARVDFTDGASVRDGDGAARLDDFATGRTVGILLPPGSGSVNVEEFGSSGSVESRGVVEIVLGKRSDLSGRR